MFEGTVNVVVSIIILQKSKSTHALSLSHIQGLKDQLVCLVFMSASRCRATKNLDDFQCKLAFFTYMPFLCDAGQLFQGPIYSYLTLTTINKNNAKINCTTTQFSLLKLV